MTLPNRFQNRRESYLAPSDQHIAVKLNRANATSSNI